MLLCWRFALFLRTVRANGFRLVQNFDDVKTLFMQSDGGLTPVASFRGSRAILSGPAGGVVGYAATSYGDGGAGGGGEEKPAVIGFDMGGTSTGGRAPMNAACVLLELPLTVYASSALVVVVEKVCMCMCVRGCLFCFSKCRRQCASLSVHLSGRGR